VHNRKIKGMQIEKEEPKGLLFAKTMTVYKGNPRKQKNTYI
jgi:hypothetical protein